ncbi:hypothetical protein LTR99_006701 [Exophiala xenobiotica]|uniref:Uncharacterized protein n=1 Tax=Vermiconidia calcicola TaxID=1690605 RepID=A0AAV9Q9C2_9PEZI|nr:hypothetical protein LTS06_005536 [Exophiala xenobiotica]KAK5537870.1 hypothetical protein LTR25_005122 [Vermiconidia calcicola]KAK5301734.1 hypothetical protein LTR99_006701 [Exophiala xenobiotica]KAK5316529.1 hypothetical protein LTR93_009330 [Exophiala xenobiotica]KAK5354264.1 hypothetical protein LTR61_002960 [Exophiala xenobiotica]
MAQLQMDSPQCAAELAIRFPSTILPRNTPPKTDRKYPTFIVITAIILSQDHEKRGVVVEMKKTMAMDSIPMSVLDDDDIGMELAIDIPDVVEVGEADVDMVILMPLMPLIDNMLLSMTEVCISALEENQKAVGVQVRFHRHKQ